MAAIELSKAAQLGIEEVEKVEKGEQKKSEKYLEAVREADRRIEEDRYHYAETYRRASTFFVR